MRIVSIIKYVFSTVGLCILIGAFLFYLNTQDFLKDALTANGTVVDIVHSRSSDSTTYRPVVAFKTQDGTLVEFTSSSGSNPPSYSKGEIVEILYPESFPQQARINSFFSLWGGAAVMGVLGAVFFITGVSIVIFEILKDKQIAYLKKNGTPIRARFQGVGINSSLKANGRSPYRICAQWKNPVTSEIHVFNSENIWFDPTDYIDSKDITVLIDKDNPRKYYVDISFLPELAG